MRKILLAEATADELRTFGHVFLGLEIKGNESRNVMLGKLSEAGYTLPFIQLTDPVVPTGATTMDGPRSIRTRPDGVREARIVVHVQDRPGGDQPVPVGVNGRHMLIPRGEPVFVPEPYIEALDHAEEYVYDEYDPDLDGGLGGLSQRRTVKSYPFSYA